MGITVSTGGLSPPPDYPPRCWGAAAPQTPAVYMGRGVGQRPALRVFTRILVTLVTLVTLVILVTFGFFAPHPLIEILRAPCVPLMCRYVYCI